MLSVTTPPRASPTPKPTGCPPPIAAKAKFLRLPTNDRVMMATADGRQKASAMPLRPRNMMISALVCESPQPRTKPACRILPTRYMNLEPNASAMEPERSREQPVVRAWIEDGHRSSPGGMLSSFAIVGRATVVRPLSSVEMAVMRVTEAMMTVVRDLEVTVSTLSRLCRE